MLIAVAVLANKDAAGAQLGDQISIDAYDRFRADDKGLRLPAGGRAPHGRRARGASRAAGRLPPRAVPPDCAGAYADEWCGTLVVEVDG